jgi:hypothetical protein
MAMPAQYAASLCALLLNKHAACHREKFIYSVDLECFSARGPDRRIEDVIKENAFDDIIGIS